MNSTEMKLYQLIDRTAGSNAVLQGLTGIVGWPLTAAADVGVLFTHYSPMLNEIRSMYGRSTPDAGVIMPVLKGCTHELISDIIMDKVLGNIPPVAIPANIFAARAMTWRLGKR